MKRKILIVAAVAATATIGYVESASATSGGGTGASPDRTVEATRDTIVVPVTILDGNPDDVTRDTILTENTIQTGNTILTENTIVSNTILVPVTILDRDVTHDTIRDAEPGDATSITALGGDPGDVTRITILDAGPGDVTRDTILDAEPEAVSRDTILDRANN